MLHRARSGISSVHALPRELEGVVFRVMMGIGGNYGFERFKEF